MFAYGRGNRAQAGVISHRTTVLSRLPVARVRPSGEITNAVTQAGPVRARPRRRGWLRLVRSHKVMLWSSLTVASVRPSGENAATPAKTERGWPRGWRWLGSVRSHRV